MRTIHTDEIEKTVYELARRACLRLTPSCTAALEKAKDGEEQGSAAAFALDTVLRNADTAVCENMPVCTHGTDFGPAFAVKPPTGARSTAA